MNTQATKAIEDFAPTDRLAVVLGQHLDIGLPKAELLRVSFDQFFKEIARWETRAKDLEVTDESQTDRMEQAKEAGKFLRNVRKQFGETKAELKRQIIVEAKAIDGIYNVLIGLTSPLEDFLDKQANFVKYREQARIKERTARRLLDVTRETPKMSNLQPGILKMAEDMDDAQWSIFFDGIKMKERQLVEAEQANARRAQEEQERKAVEDQRIREENERLKADAVERDRKAKEERERLEREQKERDNALAEERRRNEAKLKKEREERERIEAIERDRKEKEEAEKKEAAAVKRRERNAPDRQKLLNFAAFLITLRPVPCQTEEGKIIEMKALDRLQMTADLIVKVVKGLE